MESYRQCSFLLILVCDNVCGVFLTRKAHPSLSVLGFYWGSVTEARNLCVTNLCYSVSRPCRQRSGWYHVAPGLTVSYVSTVQGPRWTKTRSQVGCSKGLEVSSKSQASLWQGSSHSASTHTPLTECLPKSPGTSPVYLVERGGCSSVRFQPERGEVRPGEFGFPSPEAPSLGLLLPGLSLCLFLLHCFLCPSVLSVS